MQLRPRKRGPRKQRIACPFCEAKVPKPQPLQEVFSGDGCRGGRCGCGAVFVVDETGRLGGKALLDAQALVCDGDLDRALGIDSRRELDVATRPYISTRPTAAQVFVRSQMLRPKVWFVRFKPEETD